MDILLFVDNIIYLFYNSFIMNSFIDLFNYLEINYVFYFMFLILLCFGYILFKHSKFIIENISKYRVYLLIIFIFTSIFSYSFSPIDDYNDSRSEDYKLAAKNLLEHQKYVLCSRYENNSCITYSKMEKSPGYSFILSLYYKIFNFDNSANYLNLIMFSLSACFIFITLMNLINNKLISMYITFLYAINELLIYFSSMSESLIIMVVFISLFLMSYFSYMSKKDTNSLLTCLTFLFVICLIRAEYLFLLHLFLLFNFSKIKNLMLNNKIYFIIYFIVYSYLICHSIIEGSYHSDGEGNILRISLFLSSFKLFIQYISLLFGMFIFFVFFSKNQMMLKIYLLFYIMVITLFQGGFQTRYFVLLFPTIYVLIGLGFNNLVKYLSNKFNISNTLKIIIIFFVCLLSISIISFKNQNLGDLSVTDADNLRNYVIANYDESFVIHQHQVSLSRQLFNSNLSGIIYNKYDFDNNNNFISNLSNDHNYIFFQYFSEDYSSDILNMTNYKLVKESGDIKLYLLTPY